MDIDAARSVDDARRIDEMYEDDGLNSAQRLLNKYQLNADATIDLFLNDVLFGGLGKQEQNESANWFAQNLWLLMYHHANNDDEKFQRDSADLMRLVMLRMEASE